MKLYLIIFFGLLTPVYLSARGVSMPNAKSWFAAETIWRRKFYSVKVWRSSLGRVSGFHVEVDFSGEPLVADFAQEG